jgi:hypothetical protein
MNSVLKPSGPGDFPYGRLDTNEFEKPSGMFLGLIAMSH